MKKVENLGARSVDHFFFKIVSFNFSYLSSSKIPVFHAQSGDPYKTPYSVASDLGLHCLPMSL